MFNLTRILIVFSSRRFQISGCWFFLLSMWYVDLEARRALYFMSVYCIVSIGSTESAKCKLVYLLIRELNFNLMSRQPRAVAYASLNALFSEQKEIELSFDGKTETGSRVPRPLVRAINRWSITSFDILANSSRKMSVFDYISLIRANLPDFSQLVTCNCACC